MRSILAFTSLALAVACAPPRPPAVSPLPEPSLAPVRVETSCASGCEAKPVPDEVAQVLERRIAELRTRGGDCARYAEVLDRSYRGGQIRIREYMWRVGGSLASGEAKPSGEITLARHVDPLNVGVRTLDDLIGSMEHEAAHIAFDITRTNGGEERVEGTVRECRSSV